MSDNARERIEALKEARVRIEMALQVLGPAFALLERGRGPANHFSNARAMLETSYSVVSEVIQSRQKETEE